MKKPLIISVQELYFLSQFTLMICRMHSRVSFALYVLNKWTVILEFGIGAETSHHQNRIMVKKKTNGLTKLKELLNNNENEELKEWNSNLNSFLTKFGGAFNFIAFLCIGFIIYNRSTHAYDNALKRITIKILLTKWEFFKHKM